MLRDRIVCGTNDDTIQKRLLAEPKLTYAKALELAQGLETAAQNVKEISCKETASPYTPTRNGQQEVYKVTPEGKAELSCYRCGKAGHVASKCPFQGTKCHKCGSTGHLQRFCHSKPKDGEKRNSRSVNHVEVEEYCLLQLRSPQSTSPLKVTLELEDCPVEMEIDTGAEATFVEREASARTVKSSITFILRGTYSSRWGCRGEHCLQAAICQTAVVGGTRGWP